MPPRSLRLALGLLLLLAAAACARDPISIASTTTPGAAPADIRFATSDGVSLAGRQFGSGPTGVVLAHMFPADATSWYPAAGRLAEAGYLALAFNFRGYSPSEGTQDASRAADDLEAAVRFLREQGARDVALVGASMGGTAALVSASRMQVLAVVAISPPVWFDGLDAAAGAPGISAPVLLMAAEEDESGADGLRRLSATLPTVTTKLFAGSAHGTNLFAERTEAIDVVLDFLHEHAPATTSAGENASSP